MLKLDDGTELYQSDAILRYIGASQGEKKMYPGNNDALLSYKIDVSIADDGAHFNVFKNFYLPLVPQYKEKDMYFTNYVTGEFQQWLQKQEDLIA